MAYESDGAAVAPIMTTWLKKWFDWKCWETENGQQYSLCWTNDAHELLFPLIRIFQRWQLL